MHARLCLGKKAHTHCLICGHQFGAGADAVYCHYTKEHHQIIDDSHTIRDIHRDYCPEDYPDLDFNQWYGSFLTRRNPIRANRDLERHWSALSVSPALVQNRIRDIWAHFREAFFEFFGDDPISLHSHVGDAANPALLTSLILFLGSCSKRSKARTGAFSVSGKSRTNPRLAMLEGIYGAGFGPLAHYAVRDWFNEVANGPAPFIVKSDSPNIDSYVAKAKREGCVALIAEIVLSKDGITLNPEIWRRLVESCRKHELILIVDEAMTAIRCGAPFAHQLPEYQKHGRPDLVLFGKAVRMNGVAVDWQGINVQQLGLESDYDRHTALIDWHKRFSEAATAAELLQSTGTILLARRENWPQRACQIGRVLRRLATEELQIDPKSFGGLHGLIYLPKVDSRRAAVVSANAGAVYTRWLPTMDKVMTSKDELRNKVFGLGSLAHRKSMGEYLRKNELELGTCFSCGDAMEIRSKTPCVKCVGGQCEECEPGRHVCPFEAIEEAAKLKRPPISESHEPRKSNRHRTPTTKVAENGARKRPRTESPSGLERAHSSPRKRRVV